jgi:hypothetical protein
MTDPLPPLAYDDRRLRRAPAGSARMIHDGGGPVSRERCQSSAAVDQAHASRRAITCVRHQMSMAIRLDRLIHGDVRWPLPHWPFRGSTTRRVARGSGSTSRGADLPARSRVTPHSASARPATTKLCKDVRIRRRLGLFTEGHHRQYKMRSRRPSMSQQIACRTASYPTLEHRAPTQTTCRSVRGFRGSGHWLLPY